MLFITISSFSFAKIILNINENRRKLSENFESTITFSGLDLKKISHPLKQEKEAIAPSSLNLLPLNKILPIAPKKKNYFLLTILV